MDFTLFMPNLINMNVHSAICSWSVELCKQWYTFADFLPNWDISRGLNQHFSYYCLDKTLKNLQFSYYCLD